MKTTGSARTKARQARRVMNKLAAHNSLPVMQRKRPHEALLGARASAKLESEEAKAYFDSLIVPESGSAQYPDLSDFPTVPVSSRFFYSSLPLVQATSGNYYSVFAICPNLYGCTATATAIAADGTITWGLAVNHPLYSSYNANFCRYRPISIAYRVLNSTNLNNKAGMLYQDLVPPDISSVNNAFPAVLPDNLNQITASPTVAFGAFSQQYLEDVPRGTWLPSRLNSLEFIEMNAARSNTVLGTEYPNMVIMIDHETNTTANVQNCTYEIFFNFEAIPLYQTASLFDPSVCVGSPEKIATGLIENREKLLTGVNATLKDFQKVVGPIPEYARVTRELLGSLGSLGSVGYRMSRSLHMIKDVLPELQQAYSENKEVEGLLGLLRQARALLSTLDLRDLKFQEHRVKTGPWSSSVSSIEVTKYSDEISDCLDSASLISVRKPVSESSTVKNVGLRKG